MGGSINLANVAIGFDASKIQRGVDMSAAEMRKLGSIVKESVSPMDRYNQEIEILEKAYKKGALSADRMAQAVDHLKEKYGQQTSLFGNLKMTDISSAVTGVNQALEIGSKVVNFARSAADAFAQEAGAIDNTADTAAKLGLRYNDLVLARRAFGEMGGMAEGEIDSSMQKMQINLIEARKGTNDLAKSLVTLGLDPDKLARMMPIEAVKAISAELGKMPNQAEQLQLSMDLFGKSGAGMVEVLRQGDDKIQDMETHLRATGMVMRESQVAAASEMNDRLERMQDYWVGIKNQVTGELAIGLVGMATVLEKSANSVSIIAGGLSGASNAVSPFAALAGIAGAPGQFLSNAYSEGSKQFADAEAKAKIDRDQKIQAQANEAASKEEQRAKDKQLAEEKKVDEKNAEDRGKRIAEQWRKTNKEVEDSNRERERIEKEREREGQQLGKEMGNAEKDKANMFENAGKDVKDGIAPALKAGSAEAYKFLLSQKDKAAQVAEKALEIQGRIKDIQQQQLDLLKNQAPIGLAG